MNYPSAEYLNLPFSAAIDFFRQKISMPTQVWDELWGAMHTRAFTVAGAMGDDLLDDLRQAIDKAISSGTTLADFRKDFDKIIEKNGWSYKGTRGWRTAVIYDTNLTVAYSAGRYQGMTADAVLTTRPWWQYMPSSSANPRESHMQWYYIVLRHDDPWWDTHYPPNGWGCRCTTRSLSQRQMEHEGLAVSEAPPINRTERINSATGEVFPPTPAGIDTGWDYNVGKAWLGPDQALAERVMRLPKPWRDQALRQAQDVARQGTPSFGAWVDRVLAGDGGRGGLQTAGWLTGDIIDGLTAAGITVDTPLITASDAAIRHMLRDGNQPRSNGLSADTIRDLPQVLADPRAVLSDPGQGELLYVVDAPDRNGKLVVRLGLRQAGEVFNRVVSGGLVPTSSLRNKSAYRLLSGEL